MKTSWKIGMLLGILCAVAAFAAEISIDYKRDADFSKYKTFAWQDGMPAPNPAMHKFILEQIEKAMTAAGYTRVDSLEEADLHVLYSVTITTDSKTETIQKNPPITGLPKWDYDAFGRTESAVHRTMLSEGSLMVNIEEGKTSKLLWQGVGSGYLLSDTFEENKKAAEQAIRLMFQSFPPKKAKPAGK